MPPQLSTEKDRSRCIGSVDLEHVLRQIQPDGYGDQVRFSWQLGSEASDGPIKGTDFATIENGRLKTVVGFLDQVPATA